MSTRVKIALLMLGCALAVLMSGCGGGGAAAGLPPPALVILTTSLPDAINGQAYSQSLQATGGVPPYSWSLAAGSTPLAPGLALNASGTVTGTTTFNNVASGFNFTAQVRDSQGVTATGPVRMNAVGVLTGSNSLPNGSAGTAYSEQIAVSNGTPPFTFTVGQSSSLPAGLALSSSGLIAGTPTATGNFGFSVQVKDSGSPAQSITLFFSLFIGSGVVITTPANLPPAVQGSPYSQTLTAVGGIPPYSWSANSLPAGLSLDAGGHLTGTPTSDSEYSITVNVRDSTQPTPLSTAQLFDLVVRLRLLIQASPPLPDAVENRAYSGVVFVVGGIPPYTIELSSGSLPPGLTLQTGTIAAGGTNITGTPTALGTFTFAVKATDSESPPVSTTQSLSIRTNPPLVVQFPDNLPAGLVGQSYSFQIPASGGLPPVRWSLQNGPIDGLVLDPSSGLLSGTPFAPVTLPLAVDVQDSASPPQSVVGVPFLHIAGVLKFGTSALPPVAVNAPVNIQLGLTGGTGPFTWNIISGGLPTGLSMDSSGKITGTTPASPPSSPFSVQITDPGPPAQSATGNLVFLINPAPGRNDTIANATPLSNGIYTASISPFDDPPGTAPAPDVDVYKLTANPGAVVQVEIFAERLVPQSPLDSVIEIVDGSGNRLQTCSNFSALGPFVNGCMNDDSSVVNTLDSLLFFQVPPSATGPMTFYVRVLDWRGDARPDLLYQISISGAN